MSKKPKGDAIPAMTPIAEVNVNKMGRKPKLVVDDATLAQIKQLAALKLTQAEAAGVMLVAVSTFKKFLADNPDAKETWDMGESVGCASVKRAQFVMAHRSAVMSIWWGKQHLGQTDKVEQVIENTTTIVDNVSDQLRGLRERVGVTTLTPDADRKSMN